MSNLRFVGLDVHKETIVIAVADEGQEAPTVIATIPHDVVQLMKRLLKLVKIKSQLRVCYEAGPTGFGLSRRLNAVGISCRVITPSLIPQKANVRIKTDRRDACRLATCLRSADLTDVWVPDEKTEALRDLERARDDAKNAERVCRHQLAKFLLRNERVYDGGRAWTGVHACWLKKQKFDDPCKQRVMDDYCKAVEDATARVKRLSDDMALLIQGTPLEPLVLALMSFYGIQLLSPVCGFSTPSDSIESHRHGRTSRASLSKRFQQSDRGPGCAPVVVDFVADFHAFVIANTREVLGRCQPGTVGLLRREQPFASVSKDGRVTRSMMASTRFENRRPRCMLRLSVIKRLR